VAETLQVLSLSQGAIAGYHESTHQGQGHESELNIAHLIPTRAHHGAGLEVEADTIRSTSKEYGAGGSFAEILGKRKTPCKIGQDVGGKWARFGMRNGTLRGAKLLYIYTYDL
jgi:hypothetical protein